MAQQHVITAARACPSCGNGIFEWLRIHDDGRIVQDVTGCNCGICRYRGRGMRVRPKEAFDHLQVRAGEIHRQMEWLRNEQDVVASSLNQLAEQQNERVQLAETAAPLLRKYPRLRPRR